MLLLDAPLHSPGIARSPFADKPSSGRTHRAWPTVVHATAIAPASSRLPRTTPTGRWTLHSTNKHSRVPSLIRAHLLVPADLSRAFTFPLYAAVLWPRCAISHVLACRPPFPGTPPTPTARATTRVSTSQPQAADPLPVLPTAPPKQLGFAGGGGPDVAPYPWGTLRWR